MFGFVCVSFFIWKRSGLLLNVGQFSVMFVTADFSCFPGVGLAVHEVAEITNCLAVYF